MLQAESRTEQTCSDVCGCVLDSISEYVYLYCILCTVLYIVFPTRIRAPLESTMPNDKATSCLVHVRGEEKCCILGIIQEHWAWRDTSTENPF